MKKLMIVAFAVAFAAVAQAATYNWSVLTTTYSFNGYDAPTTGSLWSGATATAMAYYFINEASYTQAELLTAIREGTDWRASVLASGVTSSAGKVEKQTFTTTDTASLTGYILLVNDAEDYVYMSASVTKTGDASGGQVDFSPAITTSKRLVDAEGTASYSNPGWYAVANVPEPTSGLLLLLGIAGLALKRKRA